MRRTKFFFCLCVFVCACTNVVVVVVGVGVGGWRCLSVLIREKGVARVNAYSAPCVRLPPLFACVRAHPAALIVHGSGICWQWVAVRERQAESQRYGLKLRPSVAAWRRGKDD